MLLKTKQVADLLGVHVQTVRRFCRDGVLPVILVNKGGGNDSPNGHRYRIDDAEVAAFLHAREEPTQLSHSQVVRGTKHPPNAYLVADRMTG